MTSHNTPHVSIMRRAIAMLFAVIAMPLSIALAQDSSSPQMKQKLTLRPGDLIVQQNEDGWSAIKILAVDAWPDGTSAAHCLTYRSVADKPTVESLRRATVRIWHAPIDAGSFDEGWERIGNEAPSRDDLVGFVEYLKLTDFPRYLSFTGQDVDDVIRKANAHYQRAYSLGEQGKRVEAVAEYDKAIDLFPLFYEAIDNRAFTHMELGEFTEALHGFEQSLRVNPNGMAAFFSRGECLMKLGELASAEAVFREGQHRFPEQRAMFAEFLDRVRALRKKS